MTAMSDFKVEGDEGFSVEEWATQKAGSLKDGGAYSGDKYVIKPEVASGINALLNVAGKPSIENILNDLKDSDVKLDKAKGKVRTRDTKIKELRKQLAISTTTPRASIKVKEIKTKDGKVEVPNGSVEYKKAYEVFDMKGAAEKEIFDFDIPFWNWDSEHPHVPVADTNYVFREEYLLQLLWALNTNRKAWISGHTGTGKSTLVKEVAARLNWPMLRVNFDSEITRMDLIGRDTLMNDGGTTTSKFVDGILPQAMQGPYILLCDEVDFVRPDVAYVMQRALEDEGLLISEDGGRMIAPHEMFRVVATGNTQGQGDDSGIYQGARSQSTAFLDRFTVWLDVDYLSEAQEKQLIQAKVPGLSDENLNYIMKYVTEHRRAFTQAEVIQPLSPRGITALAEGVATFSAFDEKKGLDKALKTVILNRANAQDRSVLNGIVDRVFPRK